MPIIKSAKKRVLVSNKASVRNSKTKRTMREALKAFQKAIVGGKPSEINEAQKKAVSAIDTATKKNVIHKNKAARKKSQISATAKSTGLKPSSAKPLATKKAKVEKKPVPAKKATAKTTAKSITKPATKKAVANK